MYKNKIEELINILDANKVKCGACENWIDKDKQHFFLNTIICVNSYNPSDVGSKHYICNKCKYKTRKEIRKRRKNKYENR